MLFQAVMKFLSRLVDFKILVNWGMVHCLFIISLQSYMRGECLLCTYTLAQLMMVLPGPLGPENSLELIKLSSTR
jgi:hypothetical protein